MPQHKNSWPGGHEMYNFGRLFFGHHYYTLSLSNLYLGVKKRILKEIMHFLHMTLYGHDLAQEPLPWGHEIYNLGRPFHGHYYCT